MLSTLVASCYNW